MSHPIFMVLNPIFCYVSPKIVIFHELLIIETLNKCHWIWHALNPKYAPLKQFQCIFPVKINKMWNFDCLLNSPWQKTEKNVNLYREKVFAKACKSAHTGFSVCQWQMHYVRTLCNKYFLSYYGFSAFFMGRSRYRILKHDVGVKWDPRRTAAYVPSHFMVLNPIFCYVSPKIVIFHEPLIVETATSAIGFGHALNPKYVPLKQFQCICPVNKSTFWVIMAVSLTAFLWEGLDEGFWNNGVQGKSIWPKGLAYVPIPGFMGMLIIMPHFTTLCLLSTLWVFHEFSAYHRDSQQVLHIGFWNMP